MNTFLVSLASLTEQWILQQREVHLARSQPFTAAQRSCLARHAGDEVLDRARITFSARIDDPPFLPDAIATLRRHGITAEFALRGAAGITFDNCIVVCERNPRAPLLLHELVHVIQYQRLGVPGFARGYVQGLASASFIYEANLFEQVAFQLEARFAAGESFNLGEEVNRWLATQPAKIII